MMVNLETCYSAVSCDQRGLNASDVLANHQQTQGFQKFCHEGLEMEKCEQPCTTIHVEFNNEINTFIFVYADIKARVT